MLRLLQVIDRRQAASTRPLGTRWSKFDGRIASFNLKFRSKAFKVWIPKLGIKNPTRTLRRVKRSLESNSDKSQMLTLVECSHESNPESNKGWYSVTQHNESLT